MTSKYVVAAMPKELKLRSKYKQILSFVFFTIIASGVYLYDFAFYPKLLNDFKDSSRLYLSSEGEVLRLTTNQQEQFRIWAEDSEYPNELKQALLTLEDRFFEYHPGFNPFSMLNAVYETIFKGRELRGASTLTMQLARVAFGLRTQSLSGKFQQILAAIVIELSLSKRDILLSYLNLAPMGRNIQGFATASTIYFGRSLKQLSKEELLVLVSFPQNPSSLSFRKKSSVPSHHQKRAGALFKKLYGRESDFGFAEIALQSIEELPFQSPHMIDQLEANPNMRSGNIIQTSLSVSTQNKFQKVVDFYLKRKKTIGIENSVVMLLDWVENKVVAYLGSSNFFNDKINGQVNGTLMMRSPGSTLKPFVYALGIDQGLIHPELIVHDAPSMYKLPQNYDRSFLGPITVTRALNESRNVPAVVLSAQLEGPSFYQFLKNTGVANLNPESFYGHTLVLGSKELSMQQILKYYAALARGGEFKDYSFLQDFSNQSPGVEVFSKEAAVLVKDMLGKSSRPVFQNSQYQKFSDDVYWKTGTSWGYRDAWTFGIQGRYVLGVWTGDFQGGSKDQFIGIESAAPLFFELLNTLPRKPREEKSFWHKYAAKLKPTKVCSVSGQIPTKHCPHHKTAMLIEGVSPTQKCTSHRPVLIAKKTGLRSCLEEPTEHVLKVFEFWPSHVQKLYEKIGLFLQGPPKYSELCQQKSFAASGIAPEIIYPKKNEPFVLARSEDIGQFVFNASAESGVRQLFWYSNKSFLGSTVPQEPLQVSLQAGLHHIRVVDDLGRVSTKQVQVIYK